MITFMIDEITPCLKDCETGELLQTEVVELKRKSFLSQFHSKNGWYVNWSKFPKQARKIREVYDYDWTDEII